MNAILVDLIGYTALITNLFSMSKNNEFKLRLLSLVANVMYVVYGVLINALPIVLGCFIAVILHSYHLKRLKNAEHKTR